MTQRTHRGSARENIGAIFQGLGEIMERLSEVGGELTRRFEQGDDATTKKPFRGVYGFSIKVGGPEQGVRVETFGNGHHPASKGTKAASSTGSKQGAEVPVHEVREPICDTFVEEAGEGGDERFRIIAEMPGISEKDIRLELDEDILTLSASAGDKHYRKEILLPSRYPREGMSISCNNGIVDINLRRPFPSSNT